MTTNTTALHSSDASSSFQLPSLPPNSQEGIHTSFQSHPSSDPRKRLVLLIDRVESSITNFNAALPVTAGKRQRKVLAQTVLGTIEQTFQDITRLRKQKQLRDRCKELELRMNEWKKSLVEMKKTGSFHELLATCQESWASNIKKITLQFYEMSLSVAKSIHQATQFPSAGAISPPCVYPKPENILLELVVGPTNTELLATAKMIIHNNDPVNPLIGGNSVNGKFVPCWQLYLNGLYSQDKTENRVVFSKNMEDPSYSLIVPTENFGVIPPGAAFELVCVSDTPSSGLNKLSGGTNMAGAHIVFDSQPAAQFVALKVRLDASTPATFSRLPEPMCQQQGVCDMVPLDTPSARYDQGTPDLPCSLQDRIVPRPLICSEQVGEVPLASLGTIHADPALSFEATYLKDLLQQGTIGPNSVDIFFQIIQDSTELNDDESYRLLITPQKIVIQGKTRAAIFYGIQTFRQLVSQARLDGSQKLPAVEIDDMPRFSVRSTLLDVARHFIPKQDLLKQIDLLSLFKINRLHLHLSDNEGWRIEIPSIPELVEYSSIRTFNPDGSRSLGPSFGSTTDLAPSDNIEGKPTDEQEANFGAVPAWQGVEDAMNNFVGMGSGYYTLGEFQEILQYASDRGIQILPEIDLPSHAGAAIAAMEYRYQKYKDSDPKKASEYRLIDPADTAPYMKSVVNPCLLSTFAFIETVVKEIKACYDAVGLEFNAFHIGADETPGLADNSTWSKSPLCNATNMTSRELFSGFVATENALLNILGATTQVWAEALDVIRDNAQLYELLKQSGMVAQPWNNIWEGPKQSASYQLANDGFQVMQSHASNLYLDMMQSKHPQEIGTSYAGFTDFEQVFSYVPENYVVSYITKDFFGDPKNTLGSTLGQILDPAALIKGQPTLNPGQEKNIQGIEVALWTEASKNPQIVEYMLFPRIIAAADRAWNPLPPVSGYIDPQLPPEAIREKVTLLRGQSHKAWQVFANVLGKYTLPMLDFYNNTAQNSTTNSVNYRIQPPGAVIQNGTLVMNSILPGLLLQYSTDNGLTWNAWVAPVAVGKDVLVRSVTRNGTPSRVEQVYTS